MNTTETDRKYFLSELERLTYPELIARFRFAVDEIQTLTNVSVDAGAVGNEFIQQAIDRHCWQQEMIGALIEERNRAQAVKCSLEPKTKHDKGETIIAPVAIMEAYQRTEIGDAELLQQLFIEKIVYDHSEKQWYIWNNKYWEKDGLDSIVLRVANQVASQYYFLLAKKKREGLPDDSPLSKGLYQRATALRYKSRIKNVLTLAQSMPGLGILGDEWDHHPMLLGVKNGVLDLTTGEMNGSKPTDYVRTVSTCEWKGIDEPCPRFEKFLLEIFDSNVELIAFIQRLLGYAITGHTSEHIFVVFWGEGRNGKDTLLETLSGVLGEALATPVQPQVLLADNKNDNSATPHLAAMRSRRLCWVNETNDGAMLNVGQVKYLTGGGTIVARPLYGVPVTFTPQYLLVLMTNHCPKINADDYAIWQRILLVPFAQAFVDKPVQGNEHKRDPKLKETLRMEISGVLAWLVRGCLEWQKNGLQIPDIVRAATDQYRDGEDLVGRFIEEECVLMPDTKIKASEFYGAYVSWAKRNHADESNPTAFGKKVSRRFRKERLPNGYHYFGIKVVTSNHLEPSSELEPNANTGLDFLTDVSDE